MSSMSSPLGFTSLGVPSTPPASSSRHWRPWSTSPSPTFASAPVDTPVQMRSTSSLEHTAQHGTRRRDHHRRHHGKHHREHRRRGIKLGPRSTPMKHRRTSSLKREYAHLRGYSSPVQSMGQCAPDETIGLNGTCAPIDGNKHANSRLKRILHHANVRKWF